MIHIKNILVGVGLMIMISLLSLIDIFPLLLLLVGGSWLLGDAILNTNNKKGW